MKSNTIIKLFIDVTMIILYILLMFARRLGGFFHETVGIGIGILFVIHVVMNRTMIKGLLSSVKRHSPLKIILFMSDIVLTVLMPIIIVSGMFMARELFIIKSNIPWELLINIHNILSYICLGVMVLHILFHLKYLMGVFKKLPSALSGKEMKSAIGRFSAGAFAAAVLYSSLAVYKNVSEVNDFSVDPGITDDKNKEETLPDDDSSVNVMPEITMAEESSDLYVESDEALITENTDNENVITQEETTPPPTLEEYLSELNCTGCGRGCSLLSPRCGNGREQAAQAEEEYYQIYG